MLELPWEPEYFLVIVEAPTVLTSKGMFVERPGCPCATHDGDRPQGGRCPSWLGSPPGAKLGGGPTAP